MLKMQQDCPAPLYRGTNAEVQRLQDLVSQLQACAGIQGQTHQLSVTRTNDITTEFWQQNLMSRTPRVFNFRATGGDGCS